MGRKPKGPKSHSPKAEATILPWVRAPMDFRKIEGALGKPLSRHRRTQIEFALFAAVKGARRPGAGPSDISRQRLIVADIGTTPTSNKIGLAREELRLRVLAWPRRARKGRPKVNYAWEVLVKCLAKDFKQVTGKNPSVSFSSGVASSDFHDFIQAVFAELPSEVRPDDSSLGSLIKHVLYPQVQTSKPATGGVGSKDRKAQPVT